MGDLSELKNENHGIMGGAARERRGTGEEESEWWRFRQDDGIVEAILTRI